MHAYQTSSQHGQSRSPASSQQEAEQAQMPSRYPEVALSLTNYRKLFPRGLPLVWQNVHCWCCLQTKDKHTEVGQLSRIPLVFLLHFFQKKNVRDATVFMDSLLVAQFRPLKHQRKLYVLTITRENHSPVSFFHQLPINPRKRGVTS